LVVGDATTSLGDGRKLYAVTPKAKRMPAWIQGPVKKAGVSICRRARRGKRRETRGGGRTGGPGEGRPTALDTGRIGQRVPLR
jgi:hypothetical protein